MNLVQGAGGEQAEGDEEAEEEAEEESEEEGAEEEDKEEDEEEDEEEAEEESDVPLVPPPKAKQKSVKDQVPLVARRPAAAPDAAKAKSAGTPATGLDWQYGYDSEHRMAYRMLSKRGAKREWATSLEAPTPISSAEVLDDLHPFAHFSDGSKWCITNITWGDHTHALAVRPSKGTLWQDETAHTTLVLKKDRQLLLILYQADERGRDVQIVQIALKHFGDVALQVAVILKPKVVPLMYGPCRSQETLIQKTHGGRTQHFEKHEVDTETKTVSVFKRIITRQINSASVNGRADWAVGRASPRGGPGGGLVHEWGIRRTFLFCHRPNSLSHV